MRKSSVPDWQSIRARAAAFPEPAFQFVREGLSHTVKMIHGLDDAAPAPAPGEPAPSRHVSGPQLCMGLRDMAVERYGLLAKTVLRRWGLRGTDDFGVIVYAMIDRGEMRSSNEDAFEDFKGVFDFDEAFEAQASPRRLA